MEKIDKFLNREKESLIIKDFLKNFELNKNNPLFKKGIYIYGKPGSGKTQFVIKILKELNYDIIKYDTADIRNKLVIEDITKNNISDKNIMSLFNKKIQKIAIIIDEIDGMNTGDKWSINSLIKLIRPKKTKKQKLEEFSINPIICIGNYNIDKKIKELIKVCNTIEFKLPTNEEILSIINFLIPENNNIKNKIFNYVQHDLKKLNNIYNIYKYNSNLFNNNFESIFQLKSYNDDTKKITNNLIKNKFDISEHNILINETDRTSVGLLWHENIIDLLEIQKSISIPFYIKQLENICFADYIDRITFQKQIWQFNEMSSLIKTFKNNKLYHENIPFLKVENIEKVEIRFTKVLTKYSTEYNNLVFIQNLCQQLEMDKQDLFGFFIELKQKYDDDKHFQLFENYEISKLDINRIYRYLEKYTKEDAITYDDDISCNEEIEEIII